MAGANFSGTTSKGFTAEQLYSTASYQANDLHGIDLGQNDLTGWNFAGQNLSGASFYQATLSGVTLTGATVAGASFCLTTSKGFTAQQLYSTASYQAKDLHGIVLGENNLNGWNCAGQNLTGADFYRMTLSGATLFGTILTGATVAEANFSAATSKGFTAQQLYSTADYQAKDLHGIVLNYNDLTGWNFAGQNLSGTQFFGATLSGATLTGATVAGAYFGDTTGLTAQQLYGTASYQANDLHGISLYDNNLTGWNFAGQNLSGASFNCAWMPSADLTNANLTSAGLSSATLSGATLNGADLRGATSLNLTGASTTNAILPDGTISTGLHLDQANPRLIVRDYNGSSPIPIHVTQGMTVESGSTLQVLVSGPTWASTISFDPGIPVLLGGNLELGVTPGTDPADIIGTSYHLFDWTGVAPSGQFDIINDLPGPFLWDTSQLYTSGVVTLTATVPGDANGDFVVDAADYITVKQNFGIRAVPSGWMATSTATAR